MYQWQFKIHYRGAPEHLTSEMPDVSRDVLGDFGDWWHAKYFPLHFKSFARGRYGYQPRSYKYRQHKREVMGETRPLVYTGTLMHDTTSWAEVRPKSSGVKVTMRSPVLNLVGRSQSDPSYPNVKEEMTAVAPGEVNRFAEWVDEKMVDALNGIDKTKTVST